MKRHKADHISYGIVGLGRFGTALAEELHQSGAEILVIDRDEERVRALRELTENALVVKSLDKASLLETGIQNCDVAAVCIGEAMDTSILTVLHLVNLGVKRVIAKASSHEHGEILEKLGAEVIYPERDMAVRLAHRLETSRVLDFVQLSERINITKLMIPASFVGKTVVQLDLRGRYGLNIIAVESKGRVNESVRPDDVLREGDVLYLSGGKEGMLRLGEEIEGR